MQNGLRWGMALFIFSEVMFFVAWFWAFFNSSTFPVDAVQYVRTEIFGGVWPPKGTMVINPWHLPIINTVILVSSGGTLMWGLKGLKHGNRDQLVKGLLITIVLGLLFTALQAYEFIHAPFVFGYDPRHPTANNYGSTFFMATGFHGMHVIIGTIFLLVCLLRAYAGHFKPDTSSRPGIRRVVLALRGRGLDLPVHLHLRLGQSGRPFRVTIGARRLSPWVFE